MRRKKRRRGGGARPCVDCSWYASGMDGVGGGVMDGVEAGVKDGVGDE